MPNRITFLGGTTLLALHDNNVLMNWGECIKDLHRFPLERNFLALHFH